MNTRQEKNTEKKYTKFQLIKKLTAFVKPLSGIMLITIILRVIGFLIATAIPVLGVTGILCVLKVAPIYTMFSLKSIIIAFIVCAVSRGILHYGEQLSGHYIAFTLLAIIRDKVFSAMKRLAFSKLQKKDSGSLLAIITSDIELLEVFFAHTVAPVGAGIIYFVIAIIVFAQFHWALALGVGIVYINMGIILPIIFSKIENSSAKNYREKLSKLNSFFLDSLMGIKEIIFFDIVKKRKEQIIAQSKDISSSFKDLQNYTAKAQVLTNIALTLSNFLMIALSVGLYFNSSISFSSFLISLSILLSGYGPILAVSSLNINLQQTFIAAERVFSLLEEEHKIEEITDANDIKFEKIKTEKLNFKYDETPVLNNVSLELKKNEILGLCGKSGSGKSTLLKLLMRFYEAKSGKIEMNGIKINEINTKSLRNSTSYITQQTYIFNKSIYENILLARRNASKEEVIEAAKKASIHDFIESLPKGYDTKISELGQNLSSGEKQRLGLARAFLHNAPLFLLDEPTGNLDSLNEAIILNSIYKEKNERAVLIVSHRPSTMNIADKVVKIKDGKISS